VILVLESFTDEGDWYQLEGQQIKDNQSKDYSTRVYNNAWNKDVIQKFLERSPGETLDLTMKKNGKYWNIVDVALASGSAAGSPSPPATPGKKGGGGGKRTPSGKQDSAFRDPDEIIRGEAVTNAVGILAAMINAKIVKGTPEFVAGMLFQIAGDNVSFVKGKMDGTISSDSSGVEKESESLGEPELPTDL